MAVRGLIRSEVAIISGGYTQICYDSVKKVKDNSSPIMDIFLAVILTPFGLIGKVFGQQMTLSTICDGAKNLEAAEADYCLLYPNNCKNEK